MGNIGIYGSSLVPGRSCDTGMRPDIVRQFSLCSRQNLGSALSAKSSCLRKRRSTIVAVHIPPQQAGTMSACLRSHHVRATGKLPITWLYINGSEISNLNDCTTIDMKFGKACSNCSNDSASFQLRFFRPLSLSKKRFHCLTEHAAWGPSPANTGSTLQEQTARTVPETDATP